MRTISFQNGWTCRHLEDEGPGRPVLIPHDAMLAEPRSSQNASGTNGAWFDGRDYLYETHFSAGPELAGQTLVLEFEGVYRKAEVLVNGQKAAFCPYGYNNFYVYLNDYLRAEGENLIQVIARNAEQPNSRWYTGAGIYRPVWLHILPEKHLALDGVRITTLDYKNPAVRVEVESAFPGEAGVELLDGGTVLASADIGLAGRGFADIQLPGAELWSPEHPKRYTCRVTFGADVREIPFGIRGLGWGQEGILLNGARVILRGACIHHDNGVLGAACWPDAVERKIRLLQRCGYNAIRSAHNPCSKVLLEVCDRLGMLVMDEYLDFWYIHKNEYDYVEFFADWWKRDLETLVKKDYNHPSVILYSTGNEVSETAQPKGIALAGEMTQWLHTLDATRPVTCGINIFFNFLSSIGFGVYTDKKARKEAERARKAKRDGQSGKKKAVGSEFFNNMAGLLGDEFMKRGATLHGCDVKTRDAFARLDIAGYNYGIYRYKHDLKKYPDRLILGTETFCNDAYHFWELAQKEKRLVGDFVWAGMDYLGEAGVGGWEYSDYAPDLSGGVGWITAGSGRIDLTGKFLGEALYTRVALGMEQGPKIAVCPVNHTGERHSPSAWKMSNAMESWSWNGCDGRKANVEVYARAHSVALLLNGAELGRKRLKKDCLVRFQCEYHPGTLEAVAYDERGQERGRAKLVSAGEDTCLRAEAEEDSVRPEALCFVRLRYTDAQGLTKPLERGLIKVEVSGGKLLGLGSACPYYTRSYRDDTSDTYYGEALAVVLAGARGEISLTASDGTYRVQTFLPILE